MSLPKFNPLAKRLAVICAGIVALILVIMAVLPYFFKDQINQSLKEAINKNIQGQVDYSDINLSFFRHFPSLTASIEDVRVKGAAPFHDSTLIQAKEISVGVNLLSLLGSKVVLDKFLVSDGRIHVLVDSIGAANYNIYTATDNDKGSEEEGSSDSQMRFHLLQLKNIDLVYRDASIPMEITAKNLNYEGRGNLTSAVFDLQTRAQIEAFTFVLDKEEYVSNKSIDARLLTQINTNDLSFVFEKNDIKINRLPVRFRGILLF